MRFFNAIRSISMLSAVSKKVVTPPTMLRSIRGMADNQSKHVYATREVIIGAGGAGQKKKSAFCIFGKIILRYRQTGVEAVRI
ncbi:hypothetical protein CAEBREN_00051 [Caenorhabditis brenneri]|uniref:Uncharacterized protein n=1 Tax=Caenorhabditis brenneri TaxID=135651 RepID=G0MG81_CAEBE|nr:hypothetical protein CAEBREN_00051 [Caenorhabditis brenneri]